MLMPMFWTNDFDDMFDDDFFDPFDDVISLVEEPTKDEVETEKSIGRHMKKEEKRYNKALHDQYRKMNEMMNRNSMKTDVLNEGDHFTVKADLPGFDKKDIHLGLKNGILSISASHEDSNDTKDEKTGKYIRRERTSSSFARSFSVGKDVKPEEIEAKYENGVLTLTIPNKAAIPEKEEETKQIEIH